MSNSASSAILTVPRQRTVALAGNPNTGKSTVFNALTGYHQRVGNYAGVTVEKRTGLLRGHGDTPPIELVDLPGTYSLAAHSMDEAIVLELLLGRQPHVGNPDLIVVVVDASNLGRNLFLTTQILEIGRPLVVALNMIDVAEASGLRIDGAALGQALHVPVIPVVATQRTGIVSLKRAIVEALDASPPPQRSAGFPDCVRLELEGLTNSPARSGNGSKHRLSQAEALQTLLDPGGYHERRLVQHRGRSFAEELAQRRQRIEAAGESLIEVEARVRYAWIDQVAERVVTRVRAPRRSRSDAVDRVLTHRLFGLLILLLLMTGCFQSIYTWAGPLMDAIDGAIGALGGLLTSVMPAGPLQSLMVDGVIAGVGAVFVFLPQIMILFLFIAILEDCGYMARAAFLLDRWMGLLGLSGKSFIPLLSSFACAVPGIMATRTIENRRDRFVTILIAPLMSCSARLPVYILMIGAFIPAKPLLGVFLNLQAVTLLAFYFIGVGVAIPIALLLKHTILKGETPSFLMELPTYKWPSTRVVFYRAYEQGREFCARAGTIIFTVAIVIWALGYYPRPASIAVDHEMQRVAAQQDYVSELEEVAMDPDPAWNVDEADRRLETRLSEIGLSESGTYLRQSILGRMGRWIEPIVRPLGWDWRIGTAAIASFPAREVVLATMGTIYNLGAKQDETSAGLRSKLQAATWPDGRPVFNVAVALSIMVFFALCCQCGATLATIKRETQSWRWPVLTFTYMTVLAYLGALMTYQIAIRFV